jgi:hypothetical protein
MACAITFLVLGLVSTSIPSIIASMAELPAVFGLAASDANPFPYELSRQITGISNILSAILMSVSFIIVSSSNARKALKEAKHGKPGMGILVAIASIGAFALVWTSYASCWGNADVRSVADGISGLADMDLSLILEANAAVMFNALCEAMVRYATERYDEAHVRAAEAADALTSLAPLQSKMAAVASYCLPCGGAAAIVAGIVRLAAGNGDPDTVRESARISMLLLMAASSCAFAMACAIVYASAMSRRTVRNGIIVRGGSMREKMAGCEVLVPDESSIMGSGSDTGEPPASRTSAPLVPHVSPDAEHGDRSPDAGGDEESGSDHDAESPAEGNACDDVDATVVRDAGHAYDGTDGIDGIGEDGDGGNGDGYDGDGIASEAERIQQAGDSACF